jgi:nicotinamidase-related amidase
MAYLAAAPAADELAKVDFVHHCRTELARIPGDRRDSAGQDTRQRNIRVNIDPSSTAVLALHFERDVIEQDAPFGAVFNEMVVRKGVLENTAKVLDSARDAGIPVVYARVSFPAGHPGLDASTPLYAMVLQANALVQGTPGVEIVDELAPAANDIILDHEGMSAFVGGELASILDKRGIDTVVLTGVATNVIVEGTARDAVNRGLTAYVLSDCVSAGDEASDEASLGTLGLLIHGVAPSADFHAALGAAQPS